MTRSVPLSQSARPRDCLPTYPHEPGCTRHPHMLLTSLWTSLDREGSVCGFLGTATEAAPLGPRPSTGLTAPSPAAAAPPKWADQVVRRLSTLSTAAMTTVGDIHG